LILRQDIFDVFNTKGWAVQKCEKEIHTVCLRNSFRGFVFENQSLHRSRYAILANPFYLPRSWSSCLSRCLPFHISPLLHAGGVRRLTVIECGSCASWYYKPLSINLGVLDIRFIAKDITPPSPFCIDSPLSNSSHI